MIAPAASVAAQVNTRTAMAYEYASERKGIKIDDIDEATWLILKGAELVGVKIRKIAENKARKLGRSYHWSVYLIHINGKAMATWRAGKAAYPIQDFMAARKHLKNRIKNYKT